MSPLTASNSGVRDVNVSRLLKAMDDQLDQMEDDNLTRAWTMAQQRSPPHLVNDNHKVLFLRFEDYHVELACLRLLRYWSMRLELFGEDKAFERITLDTTLKEDGVVLDMGVLHLPGTYDSEGRGIYFDDSTKHPTDLWAKNKNLLRRSLVRVHWYFMECALEDEKILQNGLVALSDARRLSHLSFQQEHMRFVMDTMKCMPFRLEVVHVCHAPWFARLFNILIVRPKHFGVLIDARCYHHFTKSPEKLLRRLERHGIPRSSVPMELGGMANLNYEAWLDYRHELEAKRSAKDEELAKQHESTNAGHTHYQFPPQPDITRQLDRQLT